MRRIAGYVLIGLGVFAVALGLMLRLYSYPRLAKAPLDPKGVSVATGNGVTALVIVKDSNGNLKPTIRNDLNLTATRFVTGDLSQPEVRDGGDVMSWIEALQTVDQNGNLVKAIERQVCLDRHTNEAVEPCSNRHVKGNTDPSTYQTIEERDVRQPGISLKFPFDTEKRGYQVFDLTIRDAKEARYDGEEEISGVNTYRFVQDIQPTKIEQRSVPGSVVNKTASSVTMDLYYQVKRTMWVEPVTGQIIKGQEVQHQELVEPGSSPGQGTVVLDGTLTFDDQTVAKHVNDAKANKSKLWLLTTLPIILWIVGTLFIVAGVALLLLGRRGGGTRETIPPPARQLTGAAQ